MLILISIPENLQRVGEGYEPAGLPVVSGLPIIQVRKHAGTPDGRARRCERRAVGALGIDPLRGIWSGLRWQAASLTRSKATASLDVVLYRP